MEPGFHIAAYRGSVGAGLSDVDIAAVQDSQMTIANNHFVLPRKSNLLFAFGLGTNLSRLLLNTPKMRYVGLPSLVPINSGATVPSPVNVVDLSMKYVNLDTIDEIAVQASSADAGAQTMNAVVGFGFTFRDVPSQPTYRIRATATITQVAGSWVNGAMTLSQSLPNGRYHVVGMDCVAANGIAARLVFSGGGFRPGCLCRNATSSIQHPMFTDNRLGIYGSFDSINLPTMDIFANGAGATQEIFLDLIREQGGMAVGWQ